MGLITDIIKGLPLTAIQDEKIKELEKRINTLESENKELKIKLVQYELKPLERCPSCRGLAFSLKSSALHPIFGDTGAKDYVFSCGSCGFEDTVLALSAGEALRQIRQQ
jgi:hypothetical protein